MTSSWRRKERVKQLDKPKSENDLLAIASDNEDKDYPIYREPSATDPGKTVSTGELHLRVNLNSLNTFIL